MILRVPGNAVLLRVAWTVRHDFRSKRTENSVSLANRSDSYLLILEMAESEQ
jgi:hypothetical protein